MMGRSSGKLSECRMIFFQFKQQLEQSNGSVRYHESSMGVLSARDIFIISTFIN